MMKKYALLPVFILAFTLANAQALFEKGNSFTRADSLRGSLSPLRSCYDVVYYDLYVDIDPVRQTIASANNTIRFKALSDFGQMQVDLSDKLTIDSIVFRTQRIGYRREANAVYINFSMPVKQGEVDNIKIYYHGKAIIAKLPPWDGGLVFSKDENGKFWLGVACEGIGASTWWPCKDHLSDEPDSMSISGPAPKGLKFVSNGRLKGTNTLPDGREVSRWFVSYPINSYNATYYIGDFVNFKDTYKSPTGKKLNLDYYVLPYNLGKAKKQFAEVKPMMDCYEKYFGPYPFWNDGFKLVESPYLGMEHQSAVAYGNGYKNGYNGYDMSGFGLEYDFIIIHEGGHEWWGNNVTMADMADMWISEGFCTYGEVVYVECRYGVTKALKYINFKKETVENDKPIIGAYGVNNEGSGDMYNKGALMIHTLRSVINNDKTFFAILLGMQKDFGLKQVTTTDVISYFNTKAGIDLTKVFDQYLRYTAIPVLEYKVDFKGNRNTIKYRWKADVEGFNMPIDATMGDLKQRLVPTTEWQMLEVLDDKPVTFTPDFDHFYIKAEKVE